MAAKDSLRKDQFVEVYRGFAGVSPETLDTKSLGRHWSSNKRVAESFANDWAGEDEPSTVVAGYVHRRHIIPHDTEEWDKEAGVYGADTGQVEAEHTIRPGSPIHVTGITHWPNSTDSEQYIHRKDIPYRQRMGFRA